MSGKHCLLFLLFLASLTTAVFSMSDNSNPDNQTELEELKGFTETY